MGIVDVRLVLIIVSILFSVVLPILIVALGVALGFKILQGRSLLPGRTTPIEILKTRYARGEITKQEFETLRHDLTD